MNTTVRFTDFWKNSNIAQANFFIPLVERIYENHVTVVQDPSVKVDLEFVSVFRGQPSIQNRVSNRLQKMVSGESLQSPPRASRNAVKSIWFTGENKRPPLSQGFDSYLGYESEGFIDNVHYLPLWVLNLNNFGNGYSHGFNSAEPSQNILTKARKQKSVSREKSRFCCAFVSNPVSFRMGLLEALNRIEPIEVFGKAVNRPVNDKISVSQNYRFSIAFENNIYPGYVTEKLLEAYTSGTVPIYWGHDRESYFNPKSFINLYDFQSFQEFRCELEAIYKDTERYENMFSEPLLIREFNLERLINRVRIDLF